MTAEIAATVISAQRSNNIMISNHRFDIAAAAVPDANAH